MSLYDNWPYTDFSKVNLDWVINKVKEYILKYDSLEAFVNKSIEDQNEIIKKALEDIANAVEELKQYITDNLRIIANEIINELIESGELYIGTEYNAETEELNIVLSREV